MRPCLILTYHSQNIAGADYACNDHVALARDLPTLHGAGCKLISLDQVLDWLDRPDEQSTAQTGVALTFDDGCDFDVRELDYPGHGIQRSFLGILEDFAGSEAGVAQAGLHATSFVIASKQARRVIDAGSLFGKGWISDDWWHETDRQGLMAVENHGWDHNHMDLAGENRGDFHSIEGHEQCLHQVVQAAGAIENIIGRWPRYFAYPFGQSSPYIRERFFPEFPEVHGCRAALGTDPGPVTADSDRWNLPRYVCGRDWKSTQELLDLISPGM